MQGSDHDRENWHAESTDRPQYVLNQRHSRRQSIVIAFYAKLGNETEALLQVCHERSRPFGRTKPNVLELQTQLVSPGANDMYDAFDPKHTGKLFDRHGWNVSMGNDKGEQFTGAGKHGELKRSGDPAESTVGAGKYANVDANA